MPLHDADSIPQGHELHSKAAASPFLHFRPFTVTGRQRAAGPTGVPAEVPGCWGRGMAWSGDRAPQIFCRKRQGIGRRAGSEPGPYRVFRRKCRGYWVGMAGRGLLAPQLCRKKAGKIGHHLTWTQPGAKRGKRRKSLRPRTKTTSLAAANAAERPRKVRCQAHPAEDWQVLWALVQTSPRNLGEFDPCGQIRPQRLFSFGPCTARFLFSAQPKRGAPAGASEAGPVGRGGRNGA